MPAGTIVSSGSLVSPGGQQGIPGPNAVSTDSGNIATFGSDSKIYVPPTPAGVIWDFAGATAPTGWLLCDGSAVNRTTYAALFTAISTTYGVGDGSTTFNLPDTRGRIGVGAGQGTSLTNRALAATGGEESHVLAIAELASHTHVQNAHGHTDSGHVHGDSGHAHALPIYSYSVTLTAGGAAIAAIGSGLNSSSGQANIGSAVASIQNTTATNQNTGSGTAHNNMPPFIVFNRIIKT